MFELSNFKVGFIGGGNMAIAIAKGLVDSGLILPNYIYCSTPTNALKFKEALPLVNTCIDNSKIYNDCDCVILAVKPQYLKQAVYNIHAVKSPFIISILAGINLEQLSKTLPCKKGENLPIARVMTNTPCFVGKGISVYALNDTCYQNSLGNEYDKFVHSLFSSVGICENVPESLMDAYGGLFGSGPAYVFIIIEALSDGAVKMGIPRDKATKFAAHLLLGSSELLLQTGRHPAELKDAVCSPNGTTITAVHELEKSGLRAALMSAVEASTLKSKGFSEKSLP